MRLLTILTIIVAAASCSPYKKMKVDLPEYTWDWPEYDNEEERRRFSLFVYHTDDYSDTLRGNILVTFGPNLTITTDEGFMQGFWYWGPDTLYDHNVRKFLFYRSQEQLRMVSIPDSLFPSTEEYILTNE